MPATQPGPDPLELRALFWPDVIFYDKQVEIIRSVWANDETVVPAGNMLGKDFVAGFVAIAYFLAAFLAGRTCRVVTTSVKDDHLRVLWGEIGRFVQSAVYPLGHRGGGPLVLNHRDIRFAHESPGHYSYLRGMVSERGEGMAGHHADMTLLVIDEASGVDDLVYHQGDTWARKKLILGNPNPCVNFFFRGVRAGNLAAESDGRLYRKVIQIKAEDSPNVQTGLRQRQAGKRTTDAQIVPGVLRYSEYQKRRATWDRVRQCVGLDAEFYEGAEVLLYPPDWLNRAEQYARDIAGACRQAKTMGVDSAQGGDKTAFAICDDLGLLYLESLRTPDTSIITGRTLALMQRYKLRAENVYFDAGGGGKQHADRLRAQGHDVRIVAFGEAPTPEPRIGRLTLGERFEVHESRSAYKNRRAEMYGLLHQHLDPAEGKLFALPAEYHELRRQLAPIPLQYDGEGRLVLPPKSRRDTSNTVCLIDLLGCSPDEADALVLAVFGLHQEAPIVIGAVRV